MIKIAHRALLDGPNETKENTISQIMLALAEGYEAEIDVNLVGDKIYLGHDRLQEQIDLSFLEELGNKLWIHCKSQQAWNLLKDNPKINCFMHEDEDYCITSKGYMWQHQKFGNYIYSDLLRIGQYRNDWRVMLSIEEPRSST